MIILDNRISGQSPSLIVCYPFLIPFSPLCSPQLFFFSPSSLLLPLFPSYPLPLHLIPFPSSPSSHPLPLSPSYPLLLHLISFPSPPFLLQLFLSPLSHPLPLSPLPSSTIPLSLISLEIDKLYANFFFTFQSCWKSCGGMIPFGNYYSGH